MNSIYIEAQTILSNKPAMEWLDGCGATWCGVDEIFSAHRPKDTNIVFNGMARNQFTTTSYPEDYTHTPTALAFCQGVARIMGKPEPTFGEVVSDKIAIVYSLLNKDQIGWLKNNIGIENDGTPMHFFNCVFLSNAGNCDYLIIFQNGSTLSDLGYTITTNPTEFMEYVSQQTGKEYKVTANMNIVEGTPIPKFETTTSQPYNTPNIVMPASYPHKTYRILDSLDGIPLDTRFKLSEWIPPFDKTVLFIMKDHFATGRLWQIKEGYVCLGGAISERYQTLSKDLDGEWVRIV